MRPHRFARLAARLSLACSLGCATLFAQAEHDEPSPLSYSEHVRPIFARACFECHGPDPAAVQAELQLHRPSESLERLLSPGQPERSVLLERVGASDPEERMPPPDSGLELAPGERALLERWVAEGAAFDTHWSLRPPRRPALPSVERADWPRTAVDAFVLARLESLDIEPAPEVSPAAWLRRASLDLTGLPPTVDELDAFLAETDAGARERVVERLLASDASAEHLALQWLDNARFADSNGYQYDGPNHQWPWRDWVIEAFRSNMPFDEFVTAQLAGDLEPDAGLEQILPTAFNRNHGFTIEGGVTPEEYRVQYVNDRVVTFGTLFLGLTLECARCHDHKYDELTMRDFYSLSSFFDNIPGSGFWGGGLNTIATPVLRYPTTDPLELERRELALEQLEAEVAAIESAPLPAYGAWKASTFDAERAATPLSARALDAESGWSLERTEDGAWRALGSASPGTLVLEFELETQATDLRSLILEPVLEGGKLGRARRGEVVLRHLEARAQSIAQPERERDLVFASALGHEQDPERGVGRALSDDEQGWWLPRSPSRKQRIGVFSSAEPFGYPGGTRLRVRLHFALDADRGPFAQLRLRLSAREASGGSASDFAFDAEEAQPKRHYVRTLHANYEQRLDQANRAVREERERTVPVMVMEELPEKRPTYILQRGDYSARGEQVAPAVPALLGGWDPGLPSDRRGLARWLTDPEHPLLARVSVNRMWQMLFGVGLVATPEDFGVRGEAPSHPALLDHLALELIESDWNLRHVLSQIVLSATYRQSSRERAELDDPSNRLLARGPRFRLPAETLRDQALFVSGLLNETIGGPSVMVYQPEGLWLDLGDRPGFTRAHVVGDLDDVHRRSLYVYAKRAMPNPVLSTFDTPSRDVCVVSRQSTNTPLQALVLRHELGYVEAARAFAERLMGLEDDFDSRLERAWRMLLTRAPTPEESAVLRALHDERLEHFRRHPEQAEALLELGLQPRADGLEATSVAALTEVCRVLFNLDETVTRQ